MVGWKPDTGRMCRDVRDCVRLVDEHPKQAVALRHQSDGSCLLRRQPGLVEGRPAGPSGMGSVAQHAEGGVAGAGELLAGRLQDPVQYVGEFEIRGESENRVQQPACRMRSRWCAASLSSRAFEGGWGRAQAIGHSDSPMTTRATVPRVRPWTPPRLRTPTTSRSRSAEKSVQALTGWAYETSLDRHVGIVRPPARECLTHPQLGHLGPDLYRVGLVGRSGGRSAPGAPRHTAPTAPLLRLRAASSKAAITAAAERSEPSMPTPIRPPGCTGSGEVARPDRRGGRHRCGTTRTGQCAAATDVLVEPLNTRCSPDRLRRPTTTASADRDISASIARPAHGCLGRKPVSGEPGRGRPSAAAALAAARPAATGRRPAAGAAG